MMAETTIDRLIINSPYEEPLALALRARNRTFDLAEAVVPRVTWWRRGLQSLRRSGHLRGNSAGQSDPPRVKAWREAGRPGVTSITKRLLEHWQDPEEFEAPLLLLSVGGGRDADLADRSARRRSGWASTSRRRRGLFAPCCKMATGSGKTIVMAMVIAWHILNKVAYPQDTRFSKNVLVMAPG
jgi:type III restriction enzyme